MQKHQLNAKPNLNLSKCLLSETNLRSSDEDVFVSGQVSDLNLQLIQEQRLRLGLEERLRTMEAQLASASTTTTAAAVATTASTAGPTIIKRLPVSLLTRTNLQCQ